MWGGLPEPAGGGRFFLPKHLHDAQFSFGQGCGLRAGQRTSSKVACTMFDGRDAFLSTKLLVAKKRGRVAKAVKGAKPFNLKGLCVNKIPTPGESPALGGKEIVNELA